MAVLEAFVYDPLINWRLIKTNNEPKHDATGVPPGPDEGPEGAAANPRDADRYGDGGEGKADGPTQAASAGTHTHHRGEARVDM